MENVNLLVWTDNDGNVIKIKNDVICNDVIDHIDNDFVVIDMDDDDWE